MCYKHTEHTSFFCNYTRLTALCPGLPGWAGTRKVKPIWIWLKQETVTSSGISWAICKSASRSRQRTTPAPHHSFFCNYKKYPDRKTQTEDPKIRNATSKPWQASSLLNWKICRNKQNQVRIAFSLLHSWRREIKSWSALQCIHENQLSTVCFVLFSRQICFCYLFASVSSILCDIFTVSQI